MARARNIKPGFYKNEDLAECSIWARFIFPGLWMLADREGRLEDRPKRIKGELLPYDGGEVEPLLAELSQRGFIVRYEVDGRRFIQISKFSQHQAPHVREQASTIPAPPDIEQSTSKAVPSTNLGNGGPSPGSPDSLNPSSLNPDSPSSVPDGTVVGKADPPPPEVPKRRKAKNSEPAQILEYLNSKTGSSFKPVEANIKLIEARMRDGATPDELKRVIDLKTEEWLTDPKMMEYLRPSTLFNATKYAQYTGQLSSKTQQIAGKPFLMKHFLEQL